MSGLKILVVTGPTASGKTSAAVRLAAALDGEIISVDSRQIYRGMDIGSGKDLSEYTLPSGERIPVHLIDIAEPDYHYNLAEFMRDCHAAIASIHARGKLPVLCGGTALYLDSILRSYSLQGGAPDPEARRAKRSMPTEDLLRRLKELEPDSAIIEREPGNRIRIIRRLEQLEEQPDAALLDSANTPHPEYDFLVTGVLRSRSELHRRIEQRLDERLAHGMLDEAVRLHEQGVSWERLEFFGLEYRYMALHLQGKLTFQEMRDQLLVKIRQFAKRQDSWFRNMERNGIDIYWFKPEEAGAMLDFVRQFLADDELDKPAFRLCEIFYGPKTS
ncbi:MAG: tRNA (adenosine(37)-N6)-dimethylallyltransferase MiaA [Lentisphaeria bacterium]|nr:tRNA (adenosine(37)-N6)-dimethylallyltransferase MiaA [Lentisphaeria bacterium]